MFGILLEGVTALLVFIVPTILFGIVFIVVLLTGVLGIVLCPSVYKL